MNSLKLEGQWLGSFRYGPEYATIVEGEIVSFRLFVEEFKDGQFSGKCVDMEGIGANFEIARVEGFIQDDFISFTKHYPFFYQIDEYGNSIQDESKAHPEVMYEGFYNERTGKFAGGWQLSVDIQPFADGWLEHTCTGAWEMKKDD